LTAEEILSLADTCSSVNADSIENPDWDGVGKVYDWRNYVPEAIQENWHNLPPKARAVCIVMASKQASAEEWD
jgi:hypothetical protein